MPWMVQNAQQYQIQSFSSKDGPSLVLWHSDTREHCLWLIVYTRQENSKEYCLGVCSSQGRRAERSLGENTSWRVGFALCFLHCPALLGKQYCSLWPLGFQLFVVSEHQSVTVTNERVTVQSSGFYLLERARVTSKQFSLPFFFSLENFFLLLRFYQKNICSKPNKDVSWLMSQKRASFEKHPMLQ